MPIADGARFTSAFGKRDLDGKEDHWGIDFGGSKPGNSEYVKAAADGVVAWTTYTVPFRSGPTIKIDHPDGSATLYVHTRNCKVKSGQKVRRGEVIAESWHTGIPIEWGIHLHFEWWKNKDNHRSVFNPVSRLGDYGWKLVYDKTDNVYRMKDQWDGRPTKTATITTASTNVDAKPVKEKEDDTMSKPILANNITVWTDKADGKGLETETLSRWLLEQRRMTEAIAQKVGLSYDEIVALREDVKTNLETEANG